MLQNYLFNSAAFYAKFIFELPKTSYFNRVDLFITNTEFCMSYNLLVGEAERNRLSYIVDEVFSEEGNYYYSLRQYMMINMISSILVEVKMSLNDKLEEIRGYYSIIISSRRSSSCIL